MRCTCPPRKALLRSYPHQLSGGQQQRIAIAMAFACRPRLIVLDEPTTGLDVTTQRHVLETISSLTENYGIGRSVRQPRSTCHRTGRRHNCGDVRRAHRRGGIDRPVVLVAASPLHSRSLERGTVSGPLGGFDRYRGPPAGPRTLAQLAVHSSTAARAVQRRLHDLFAAADLAR